MAVDFTEEERSFLTAAQAEEALKAAGVLLEDLRPRAPESFDEATREVRAKAYEERRQYLWSLVRQELTRLQAKSSRRGSSGAAAPRAATASAQQGTHEAALQQMVARETRALERELRAEAQRERLERRQDAAAAARNEALAEKERVRAMKNDAREFLGDMRAARRGLAAQGAAGVQRPRPTPRPSSAPTPRPRPMAGFAPPSSETLSVVVRARAENTLAKREAEISAKMARKEEAYARRREAVENEREVKKLYAEQTRLRHEERFAGVQLTALQQTWKTQRELEDRQSRAERERAALRAAVGKVSASAEGGGVAAMEDAREERTSKVAARAANAATRLEEQNATAMAKERLKQQRAAAARDQADRQAENDKRQLQIRQHEQAMRRAARLTAKQVSEEVQRARVESDTQLASQRSAEVRKRTEDDRAKKKMDADLKAELHRENAERVRRAEEYRASKTQSLIEEKNLRYEQRRQMAAEGQELRIAFAVTRAKQQAAMGDQLRKSSERDLERAMRKAKSDPNFDTLAMESQRELAAKASAAPPPRPKSSRGGAASAKHPGSSGRLAIDAGEEKSSGAGRSTASAHSAADKKQRAAFASIERLRAQQNVELRAAVESEQRAEKKRSEMLLNTPEGADRVRLQKLLKMERERADSELMGLTAEHECALIRVSNAGASRHPEPPLLPLLTLPSVSPPRYQHRLALAELFKKAGVTR